MPPIASWPSSTAAVSGKSASTRAIVVSGAASQPGPRTAGAAGGDARGRGPRAPRPPRARGRPRRDRTGHAPARGPRAAAAGSAAAAGGRRSARRRARSNAGPSRRRPRRPARAAQATTAPPPASGFVARAGSPRRVRSPRTGRRAAARRACGRTPRSRACGGRAAGSRPPARRAHGPAPRPSAVRSVAPPALHHLRVAGTRVGSADGDQLDALGAGLEAARRVLVDAQRVEQAQLHDLVADLRAGATADHDVDLLLRLVRVPERQPIVRPEPLVAETRVLELERHARHSRLEVFLEPEVRRLVFDVVLQIELSVTHGTSWISTGPMVKFERMKQLLE